MKWLEIYGTPKMTMSYSLRLLSAFIFLSGLVAACSNSNNNPPSNSYPTPAVGQWVTYGATEPAINGNSFAFHCCDSKVLAGYFYTQLPAIPKVGQTLTLNYTVGGNNPGWANNPNGGDSGAPTIHLFLWQRGDDLQCTATTNSYREFAGRTPLALGANQTISVPLEPSQWTVCLNNANPTAAQFNALLGNLLGAGFTFGGQFYAGHGIYLSSGNAAFTINSFVVQ